MDQYFAHVVLIYEEYAQMMIDFQNAIDQLAEFIETETEAEAEALPADEILPKPKPADFLCSCRNALRLDRIPWYTSGFQ